jgi:hypothetical protein
VTHNEKEYVVAKLESFINKQYRKKVKFGKEAIMDAVKYRMLHPKVEFIYYGALTIYGYNSVVKRASAVFPRHGQEGMMPEHDALITSISGKLGQHLTGTDKGFYLFNNDRWAQTISDDQKKKWEDAAKNDEDIKFFIEQTQLKPESYLITLVPLSFSNVLSLALKQLTKYSIFSPRRVLSEPETPVSSALKN